MKPKILFVISLLILTHSLILAQVRSLDDFIQNGLSNSPLLKDLNNQVRSNTIDSLLIKSTRYPKIDFNGYYSYAPVINGYGYSEAITNGNNFITTLNLSQPLFNQKTLEAKYSKIGYQNQSLENNIKITENDVRKAITDQYLVAYSVNRELAFKMTLLESMKEEEDILKRLTENGVYKQTDYLSFRVELQGALLSINNLKIQYGKELATLNYLCGISDTAVYDLPQPNVELRFPSPPPLSPLFQRFRIDSLSILNEKTLLDRNYKPAVNWFSDAGVISNDPSVIYKNFGFNLGISFSLPVFDGNQRRLNYQKLKTFEETRKGYRDYFSNQYYQQIRQLNDELEQTKALLMQLQQEVDLTEALVKQDRELLGAGGISITDYVMALRNYILIQHYMNQYQVMILQIINEINYWRQ